MIPTLDPYGANRRDSPDPSAITYYFTHDPRSGLCALLTGVAALDDPNMTLTLSFGTRKHVRFVETLSIEQTPSQDWLHNYLTGHARGVKLMAEYLPGRIEPLMHVNAMIERFVTLSGPPAETKSDVFRNGNGPKRREGKSPFERCKGDLPCPKNLGSPVAAKLNVTAPPAHDHTKSANSRTLLLALLLTGTFLIVKVTGSFVFHSPALLSDAGHMLTGVAALTIALMAIQIGARLAEDQHTFGYRRFEIVDGGDRGLPIEGCSCPPCDIMPHAAPFEVHPV